MWEQQVKKHLFKKTYENSFRMFRIYNSWTKTPTPLSALWHVSSLLQPKTQASSPSTPNWKALYLGKAGYQSFSSCPQLPVAEVKSWVWLRSGSSLLFSLHSENGGSTLSVACLEYWDTDHLCPGSWRWFHARRDKLRPQAASPLPPLSFLSRSVTQKFDIVQAMLGLEIGLCLA